MARMSGTSRVWRVVEEWLDVVPFPPSQSKIAERVGVSRSAVSDWKSGKTRPAPENLEALAEMMEPQLGPDVGARLMIALMRDLGYVTDKRIGDNLILAPAGISADELEEQRRNYARIQERFIDVPPREHVRALKVSVGTDGMVVISMLFNEDEDDEHWTHRALDPAMVQRFIEAGYSELEEIRGVQDPESPLTLDRALEILGVAADEQPHAIESEQEEPEHP